MPVHQQRRGMPHLHAYSIMHRPALLEPLITEFTFPAACLQKAAPAPLLKLLTMNLQIDLPTVSKTQLCSLLHCSCLSLPSAGYAPW